MNIRMFQQRVLIKQDEPEQCTDGILTIPDSVTKHIGIGHIVAIDEGKLRVGDKVVFDTRQILPFRIEKEDYVILHESQIIAVLSLLTSNTPEVPAQNQ